MVEADRYVNLQVFPDPNFRLETKRIPNHGASGADQHAHTFHELVVIMDGHGKHGVGEEVYDLEAGDVFVILGDTRHGYPQTDQLSLINILYDPRHLGVPTADLGSLPGYHSLFRLEPRLRQTQKFENRLRLDIDQLAHVSTLIAALEEELREQNRGFRFMAITYLMQIIAYLSRSYSRLERDDTRPVTQVGEILGYMEQHYMEALTVEELTNVVNMSQTSLMRHFREVMGRSPIEHLIHLRISRARQLLRTTRLAVSEIAFRVGFTDSNYFSRQFRRVTGTSPSKYRKRMTAKA